MHIDAGATIADPGWGNGGVGLWLARELGTTVIATDLSPGGGAAASEHAARLGFGDRVRFLE